MRNVLSATDSLCWSRNNTSSPWQKCRIRRRQRSEACNHIDPRMTRWSYNVFHMYWVTVAFNSSIIIQVDSKTDTIISITSNHLIQQNSYGKKQKRRLWYNPQFLIRGGTCSISEERNTDDNFEHTNGDSDKLSMIPAPNDNDTISIDDNNHSMVPDEKSKGNVFPVHSLISNTVTTGSTASSANPNDVESLKNSDDRRGRKITPPLSQQHQNPPNSIYRFLLRQGYYGHIVVMAFVLITEWLSLYVPQLAICLEWVLTKILPDTNVDEKSRYGSRKKLSRKERKLQTKHDDQIALQQLRQLDIKLAKYRYVSDEFLQRHELGMYSRKKVNTLTDVSKIIDKRRKDVSMGTKQQNSEMDPDNEGDDIDWVVKALTEKKSEKKRPFIQPSISIGVGSDTKTSIGIGFEVDFGSKTKQNDRRTVIAQAITTDSNRRIKRRTAISKRQQPSNTDSILDKFRSVTGTDSVTLSRTLLGAYPGDAVPITEAASPNGVIELAQRYGYGEWHDSDAMDDTNDSDIFQSLKKKLKQKQASQMMTENHQDINFAVEDKTLLTTPKRGGKSTNDSFSLEARLGAGNRNTRRQHKQRSSIVDKRTRSLPNVDSKDAKPIRSESAIKKSIILQRHVTVNAQSNEKSLSRFQAVSGSRKMYSATELLSEKRNKLLSELENRNDKNES